MVQSLTTEDVKKVLPEATDIEEIGKGGQKQVFKVKINNQNWAIKFVHLGDYTTEEEEEEEVDKEALERVEREIKILREVKCEHLAVLAPLEPGIYEKESSIYIYYAEEFIEGTNLRKLIQRGAMSIKECVLLGIHITKAIQVLWKNRIVHRDIKPENIIFQEKKHTFVLLDPGIALIIGEPRLTKTGFVVGTPLYMSPEQTRPRASLDFRSDLYSLGIVMYEAITGKHPYNSQLRRNNDLFEIISNYKFKPIEGIPSTVNRVVGRLLSKDPHLRYRNCQKLLSELESIIEEV